MLCVHNLQVRAEEEPTHTLDIIQSLTLWFMVSPTLAGVLTGVAYVMAYRRPFPAGDRVTFNGKDCLCQYCAEPMSPGHTKDVAGPSSECRT